MTFDFLKYRKFYYIFSGSLILLSLLSMIIWGFNFGIDFTGGLSMELEYKDSRPPLQEIKNNLDNLNLGFHYNLRPVSQKGIILTTESKDISQETQDKILESLRKTGELKANSDGFEAISPTIGAELKHKTKIVVILALLAIILYISFAFRKISRPVSSWQYGLAAIIALFHDVFITLGVFSVLGKFYGAQITIPIVTALLTVVGYSVNDTVVVFDRTRENLLKEGGEYEEIVNKSLNQTLGRSINTSLTTLLVLFAIFFFGGATLKYFSLALIIGIALGTYSSIFIASPILVSWLRLK